jgi:hypothetical protein
VDKIINKISFKKKFIIWIIINILALIYGEYLIQGHKDGLIVFTYIMLLISFPFGFIFIYIILIVEYLFKTLNIDIPRPPNEEVLLLIEWVEFVIAGYIQWFIIIPKIKNWWRSLRDRIKD